MVSQVSTSELNSALSGQYLGSPALVAEPGTPSSSSSTTTSSVHSLSRSSLTSSPPLGHRSSAPLPHHIPSTWDLPGPSWMDNHWDKPPDSPSGSSLGHASPLLSGAKWVDPNELHIDLSQSRRQRHRHQHRLSRSAEGSGDLHYGEEGASGQGGSATWHEKKQLRAERSLRISMLLHEISEEDAFQLPRTKSMDRATRRPHKFALSPSSSPQWPGSSATPS